MGEYQKQQSPSWLLVENEREAKRKKRGRGPTIGLCDVQKRGRCQWTARGGMDCSWLAGGGWWWAAQKLEPTLHSTKHPHIYTDSTTFTLRINPITSPLTSTVSWKRMVKTHFVFTTEISASHHVRSTWNPGSQPPIPYILNFVQTTNVRTYEL